MPKVSIVIPCYNQRKYLEEAVNSVLSQTYEDFEIIVINDGSTDKLTNDLLSEYKKSKTRVITTSNQGVAAARNIGIKEAKGEYILPLDADDKISPEYLEQAVKVLDDNPKIGIAYCKAEFFGKKKGPWKLPKYSLGEMLIRNIIFCCALFRKSDWEKARGYKEGDETLLEDWDFWLSLIELGVGVHRIPKYLFHYRITKTSRNTIWGKMTSDQKLNVWLKTFDNHEKLYKDNLRLLLKYIDIDNAKGSLSYKIGRAITKPLSYFINLKYS